MSELKILVCGDVSGNFRSLFSKVNSILKKKGAFEYLFCVGNFFGSHSDEWEDLKSGKIKVPLTTYILGPNDVLHEKFYNFIDSVPNITYLGKKGCLTGISGLKIAYLSGLENLIDDGGSKNDSIYFYAKNVSEMINNLESESAIDILLTSQWPKGITKYAVSVATVASNIDNSINSSSLISKLAKALKPRYHFCGLAGLHYERVPYRNHEVMQEAPKNVTRFFALAPVNNTQKQKWLYAFNITPACLMSSKQLTEVPAVVTICPYELKGSFNKSDEQFFFDTTNPTTSRKRSQGDHSKHQSKKLSIDPSSCWFCFSNLDVEKQLIVSIGNHCYITLAKGVLVPEHVLIVPIHHAISSVELSSDVSEEIENFKKSLAYYFDKKNKDVVFFERNYSSPHLQIQVVPVPKQMKTEIKAALFTEAAQYDLEFKELPNFCNVQQVLEPNKPFFYFELMVNNKSDAKYLHIVKGRFPLQFGRTVLASPKVLNVPDRVEWKRCIDSKSVEKEMTEKMRKAFGPYDFNVQ